MTTTNHIPSAKEQQDIITRAESLIRNESWKELATLSQAHHEWLNTHEKGLFIFGVLAWVSGRYQDAQTIFSKLLQQTPNDHEVLYFYADCLYELHQCEAAMQVCNQLVKQRPYEVKAYILLGRSLYALNYLELAEKALNQALQLEPENPDALLRLSNVKQALSQIDDAKTLISKALELAPRDPFTLMTFVRIHHFNVEEDIVARCHAVIDELGDNHAYKAKLYYALAGIYEKRQQLEQAFDCYALANQLADPRPDTSEPLNVQGYHALMDGYAQVFAEYRPERGCQQEGAIFVLGMPRSGSTLTEQIISSHTKVAGAGELYIMRHMVDKLIPKMTGRQLPDAIEALSDAQLIELGQAYMHSLRAVQSSEYVIDKMPSNWIHVPLILRMLPKAKIIFTRRDPIDTCWSIWRQDFRGHGYRYQFHRLAALYAVCEQAMQRWLAMYPDQIFTMDYEILIADTQTQAKRMIEFCGLDWQEQCLEFYKQPQRIRTASVNQANQPIYTTSQRSWLPIADKLKPLIDALHERGIETCVSRGEVAL